MVLKYEDRYVWDHWMYREGENFHMFYLQAKRETKNASERHEKASIGHAISQDLINWSEVGTAITKSLPGSWDDLATWTGSIIQSKETKEYFLFYTGVHRNEKGLIQSIGLAISSDLNNWKKYGNTPVAKADSRFYATQENGSVNTDFRDPWVFFDELNQKWHMLITANSSENKDPKKSGVVGHAISENLVDWQVLPPIATETGFGQIEVFQVVQIRDKYVGIFCCGKDYIEGKSDEFTTGTYSVPMHSPIGPIDFNKAEIFHAKNIYAGRIIQNQSGQHNLIGFVTADLDSNAPCEISNPIRVTINRNGNLQVI